MECFEQTEPAINGNIFNGTVTYYPFRQYLDIQPGGTEKIQKYYSVGSQMVAVSNTTGGQTTLNWILSDQVGSTTVTANADGTWNSEIRYSAFGEIRYSNGITQTNYRYTGQLAQDELGLDYYVARWYDPVIAHFAQADTEAPQLGQSQTFDRYMYANDNPIRYNDPTGHDAGCMGMDCSDLPPTYKPPVYIPPTPTTPIQTSTPRPSSTPQVTSTRTPTITTTATLNYYFRVYRTGGSVGTPVPTQQPKVSIKSGPTKTPTEQPSSPQSGEINIWESLRNIADPFDPTELGPFTGWLTSPVQAYLEAVGAYAVYSLQQPNKALVALSVFAPLAAMTYDYTYDQITHTGPHKDLPPNSLKTPEQKILFWTYVGVIGCAVLCR